MSTETAIQPTALARRLVMAGELAEAERVIAGLITRNFGLVVSKITVSTDWSSLNSLNGSVLVDDGRRFFFKFHQEEGEEVTVQEYYRAGLLQRSGLPVDMPAMICPQPGQQILLYHFRRDRQLAEVCLQIERNGDGEDHELADIVELQTELDRATSETYLASLHASTVEHSVAEPIHQLFWNRLSTGAEQDRLGGRVGEFYQGQKVSLPGTNLSWDEFSRLSWRINGVDYGHSIDELFRDALVRLNPARLGDCGAVTAHGDAHNANVWIEQAKEGSRLVLFDPAFAGEHVPTLLADIKATFHNVFAHPFWLYHPSEAGEHFKIEISIARGKVTIEHDWALPPLRKQFLEAKVSLVWRPLIAALADGGLLPADWVRVIRLALFCCPTLVMNLRAGAPHGSTPGRPPAISALSFAIAVMAGSEPIGGSDLFSDFLAAIAPSVAPII